MKRYILFKIKLQIRQNDKSLTTANVELRQLLWLESIKARMSDNINLLKIISLIKKLKQKNFKIKLLNLQD